MKTKIGQVKSRKFSGIKLLKKAVEKVNKKVSGHTYVKYVIEKSATNGTTVKSREVRIYQ